MGAISIGIDVYKRQVMKSILQMESKAEEQKKKSVMNLARLKTS